MCGNYVALLFFSTDLLNVHVIHISVQGPQELYICKYMITDLVNVHVIHISVQGSQELYICKYMITFCACISM